MIRRPRWWKSAHVATNSVPANSLMETSVHRRVPSRVIMLLRLPVGMLLRCRCVRNYSRNYNHNYNHNYNYSHSHNRPVNAPVSRFCAISCKKYRRV